jgi:hypothetical protein
MLPMRSFTNGQTIVQSKRQYENCLRKPVDEPTNICISSLYTEREIPTGRQSRPKRNYYDQIADFCDTKGLKPTSTEIVNVAQHKSNWRKIIVAPYKPAR